MQDIFCLYRASCLKAWILHMQSKLAHTTKACNNAYTSIYTHNEMQKRFLTKSIDQSTERRGMLPDEVNQPIIINTELFSFCATRHFYFLLAPFYFHPTSNISFSTLVLRGTSLSADIDCLEEEDEE